MNKGENVLTYKSAIELDPGDRVYVEARVPAMVTLVEILDDDAHTLIHFGYPDGGNDFMIVADEEEFEMVGE
jgi:hypothetical protein